jgi:hypothetical protein
VAGDTYTPTCDACGYALRGLPRKHTCPECGTPYNHESCEIQTARAGPHWGEFIIAAVYGVFVFVITPNLDPSLCCPTFGFWLVYMLYLLCRIRWAHVPGNRLILTHDTVIIVLRGRAQRIPIADINRAEFVSWRQALVLTDHAGRRILLVSADDLGGAHPASIAARRIIDWVRSAAYYDSAGAAGLFASQRRVTEDRRR